MIEKQKNEEEDGRRREGRRKRRREYNNTFCDVSLLWGGGGKCVDRDVCVGVIFCSSCCVVLCIITLVYIGIYSIETTISIL